MPDRLDDQHAATLLRPHLGEGEALLAVGHGLVQPWWTHIVRLGTLWQRHYVMGATRERLLLVEHGPRFEERSFAQLAWQDVRRVELGGGLLLRRLVVATDGETRHFDLPRYSPLTRNFDAGERVVALWSERKTPAPPARAVRSAAG